MWSKITQRSISHQIECHWYEWCCSKSNTPTFRMNIFFVFLCEKKNGCYFCSQLVSQKFLSAVAMNASKGHGRTNVFHTCCCCRGWSWREVGVIIRKTHSVLNSNKSKSLEIVCTYLYWNYQRIRINKYFFKSSGV